MLLFIPLCILKPAACAIQKCCSLKLYVLIMGCSNKFLVSQYANSGVSRWFVENTKNFQGIKPKTITYKKDN